METAPQPRKQSRVYGIIGTLAFMVLAFIAGIYVGMHPNWIPNMPWAWQASMDQQPGTTPQVPTTEPTDNRSMERSQTQPSPGSP
jgi:hypothetical protein